MKKTAIYTVVALALAGVGSMALADKELRDSNDPALATCVQQRLQIASPKVIRKGERAQVKMKITNGMPFPVRTIYLRYTVNSTSGTVLRADPVSLTVPPIAPGQTTDLETPFFGLPKGSPDKMVAGVKVFDVADPEGNQIVKNEDIIGYGWTGRKSEMGCS